MSEPLEAGMTTLKLPYALKDRMYERTKKSGVAQSEIIRRGIAMYLDEQDRVEQMVAQLIAQQGGAKNE